MHARDISNLYSANDLLTRTSIFSFFFLLQEFVVFFSYFVVCHFPLYSLGLNLEFEPTIQGERFLNSITDIMFFTVFSSFPGRFTGKFKRVFAP